MSCENSDLVERLLEYEKKLDDQKDDLDTWIDALEELPEIENAFEDNGKIELHAKTILDVGTDAVKPLYISLKFKPSKILGISEELRPFATVLEQKSKLVIETQIRLYNCSLFDKKMFDEILKKERIDRKFDFVLVSKALHHLRTGKCVANERNEQHECREDEGCCIYGFKEKEIFKRLLELGKRVIIYEYFDASDIDNDKIRGRGGYFTTKECKRMLVHLSGKYKVEFISPERFHLDEETINRVDSILRQVDFICFYVEERH